MPRPRKRKTIHMTPECRRFSPATGSRESVVLSVEELEAIRLSDLEGLDQSACARQLNVARTTAQNLINSAHRKVAQALVKGLELEISGGEYEFVDDNCCWTIQTVDRVGGMADMPKEANMILAITCDPRTEEVFQHFGRTEFFKVYRIEDGKILSGQLVSTNGQGHGALAGVLSTIGADALICGGIGGGAQMALAQYGVKLFGGVTGKCDDAAQAFVEGRLQYQEDIRCDHHEHHHEEGHECCGGHGHEEGHECHCHD